MRYASGDPILADCDHHHQAERTLDPDYERGAQNAWTLAQALYNHPTDLNAIRCWDSARELARSEATTRRYSLGWLHAAYVARAVLNLETQP